MRSRRRRAARRRGGSPRAPRSGKRRRDFDPGGNRLSVDLRSEVSYGTSVQLEAVAAANDEFVGWSDPDCGTALSCTIDADADQVVGATFARRRARVSIVRTGDGSGSVASEPEGIVCGASCEARFDVGSMVVLTASAASDSRFITWDGACQEASGPVCTVSIDTDVQIEARFERTESTVEVIVGGSGTGTVRSSDRVIECSSADGTCRHEFPRGTRVTLTASPGSSSTFDGWSGSPVCNGTGPCNLPLERAQSVTAIFSLVTHTLSVSRGGPGIGTVDAASVGIDCGGRCSADVAEGTTVTLIARPKRHHRFAGWSGDCVGEGESCDVVVDGDRDVGATFELIPRLGASFQHACATYAEGRLRCWGLNDHGQLGYGHTDEIGDNEAPSSAGDVQIGARVEAIALGFRHTCIIMVGGGVRCWGDAASGQIGTGSTEPFGDQLGEIPSVPLTTHPRTMARSTWVEPSRRSPRRTVRTSARHWRPAR